MSGQEEYKEYEELTKFLFNEIKARDDDPDVEEIKNAPKHFYSSEVLFASILGTELLSRKLKYLTRAIIMALPEWNRYQTFIDKVRTNGKWDFKPKLQKVAKKFYSKNKIWPNTGEGHII